MSALQALIGKGAALPVTLGFAVASLGTAPAAPETRASRVVINEIMYHPADDRDEFQFIEVCNAGASRADLSGWRFTKGVEFTFPRQTRLEPGACLVVCRNISVFRTQYGPAPRVAGAFTGKLSHKGECIELVDAQCRQVDSVAYNHSPPWPRGSDGYGSSLERICPAAPGDDPHNWASSEPALDQVPAGTPGSRNTCFSESPLPKIMEVRFDTPKPDQPINVTATVADPKGVLSVALAWSLWPSGADHPAAEIPLTRQAGDAQRGVYTGCIPAQAEDQLIRFTVQARSTSGAERVCPSRTEPRPAFSCATFVNSNDSRIPFFRLLTTAALDRPARRRPLRALASAGLQAPGGQRSKWACAAICIPPGAKDVLVFDYVRVSPRKGGWKVHFHADQPFYDMTGINVIFEAKPRYVLSEPLAYELYRRAGVPTPASHHVRLWINDKPAGYYLVVEQPNSMFFRRNGRNPDGNVYKLLWYGRGLIGQHEKKNNLQTGHQDLIEVIEGLRRVSNGEQWDFIQQHFNVDETASYYAVNMCIQNWDGFFNNYFAYHDPQPGGKWEIIPWDEDKTWGDHDGASLPYDWYSMPLTIGMKGDKPVGGSWFGGGPFGGSQWWRPPGYLSGPLLANPQFRAQFEDRLQELCNTVFTPETMGPVIQAMADRLEEEVRVRASLAGADPDEAVEEFHNNIKSIQDQVVHRRKWILDQLHASAKQRP